MGSILIQDSRLAGATMLPDDFVDYYMPRANGEFVKIFLHLLRSAHAPDRNPSLSSLADVFSCTEKDILRALRYWEKAGLLKLRFSEGKSAAERELEEITLLPVSRNLSATRQEPDELYLEDLPDTDAGSVQETSVQQKTARETSAQGTAIQRTAAQEAYVQGTAARNSAAQGDAASDPGASAAETASKASSGRGNVQISSTRLKELKDNEDARKILYVAERYLGRPLSTTDMRRLLYFYDELHFPFELLDYLIEYSVARGGRSLNYIEKVGLSWHADGIRTLREAKAGTNPHNKEFFAIFKAFGIRNRDPIPDEKKAMTRWLDEYGFSLELIAAAAARTVRKTGQPSFPYTERILADWHRAGVRTPEDVAKEDARHQESLSADRHRPAVSGRTKTAAGGSRSNRFSDFSQRNDYDFDRLEENKRNRQSRQTAGGDTEKKDDAE